MGLDIESLLISPQRPRVLVTAAEEQNAALQMMKRGAKRRPRAERNKEKTAENHEAIMAEKRERLAEAKKDLEEAEKLRHTRTIQEATCAAEIDEEAQPLRTANFRPTPQAVRSEADTATVLSAWASSAAAQECPDVVDMIEEDGPFAALAKIQDRISCLQPNHCEPIPEVACRMLFSLIFKGCPRGSEHAVIILKQVIDASCPQPCDASCYAPSEPKYSNKLSSSLDWVPSDSEFLQVLRDLGYVAPGDAEQLPYDPPKEHVPMAEMLFGKARQWHLEMQQHPNEHNVIAVCVALVLLSDAFLTSTSPESDASTPRTPTAAPPFGRSPPLLTALARLHHDRSLTLRNCRRTTRTALDALVALGSGNRAWGTSMALEIPTLLRNMPSSQATSTLCYTFASSLRAIHVQQAAAAHALLALHGCSEAVSIENVFEVPVKAVVQQLGTAQDIFARLTPSDDSTGGKPIGWEVLTTMELLFQVVEPQLHVFIKAAHNGMAISRSESLLSLVEPIAKGVEKGLKKRQSVSVMRTRLLCTAIVDILRESEALINDTARSSLRGKTVVIE